jgi:hypothetical protein
MKEEHGVLRAIAIVLLVTACVISTAAQQVKPASAVSEIGRYQIIESQFNSATFLLDTTNGRVWILSRFPNLLLEPSVWEPMERLDTKEQIDAFLKLHPPKATQSH